VDLRLDNRLTRLLAPDAKDSLQGLADDCQRVQIKSVMTDAEYQRLGRLMANRPDVQLWVDSGYPEMFPDLTFLRHFQSLRKLRLTVFELKNWDGLQFLPDEMEYIDLGWTRTKAHTLEFLSRFQNMRILKVEGHTKGIDAVSSSTKLNDLVLRSVPLPDLAFLTKLDNLEILDLKLGGIKDISHLPEIGRIKYLELWMIRGLTDLAPIGSMSHLEHLHLESLRQVEALPDMSELMNLHTVLIQNLKGLTDLSPLADAPALRTLIIWDGGHLKPENLECLVGHPTLEKVSIGLGSDRKNKVIDEMLGFASDIPSYRYPREWCV